jgi:HEAT repeat protein
VRLTLALAALLSIGASSGAARALVWPDVPERIERALASPDPGTRRAAARELATLGTARATPLVLKAMADADAEVRLAAAQSAIRLHVAPAADVAMTWLGEREARLRVAACEVALAMPNPRSVQALGRALGDADAQVRAACADALGAQASPEAVAPLSGKLDDPTPVVRTQVARALAKLGDSRAVVPLVGKVQDSVPEVRQAVVRALGELGDPRATSALLLALRDNVPEVKIEALSALGRLRAPEAASAIAPLAIERNLVRAIGAAEDGAQTLERTAVRDALVSAGPTAIAELTAVLERPSSPAVATTAAWVLGELHATSSAPVIVTALRKGSLPPAAALHALAGAGTADQVPVVLEFVADPTPAVREQALRAASALLDPARPDGRAVEPLAATLKSPRTSLQERAAVAMLLGRTGAPRAAGELAGLVSSKDLTLRLAAIDALGALGGAARDAGGTADDALVPLLSDADAAVRLHAAVALAQSGGAKARAALLSKLDGGDEVDRYAVLAALGGIFERHADEPSAARLAKELAVAAGPERDAVIEALGRARLPSVVHTLGEAAKRGDVDDRRSVAAVLGAHRGAASASAAVALVRGLLGDPDASVRAQAAWTLGALGDLSTLPALAPLARGGDADVATNATGAMARIAAAVGKPGAAAIGGAACPLLSDGRATVRANAAAALAGANARCGDGKIERRLLADDPSDLVRAAAARALTASPTPEDRAALDRCVSTDRSAEVARLCRPRTAAAAPPPRAPRAVTIFVVGESGAAAKPRAPFLLELDGGVLRAGVADRRGAAFEPQAPSGDVALRRPPVR